MRKSAAGLYGIGVEFLELVYGVGDPLKTCREMACVENRGKRMGKCVRHGNGAGVWEAARPYGEPKSH